MTITIHVERLFVHVKRRRTRKKRIARLLRAVDRYVKASP